jgi:2-polyprenyl-3-methyl-5-hydroxy-6-metoxy-1,4-benzoquinol methylase
MLGWRDFWNSEHFIYVNSRHRNLHYHLIAHDAVGFISSCDDVVLDYGCGEAIAAEMVAACCRNLILSDAAPNIRTRLSSRFAGYAKIAVLSPEEVSDLSRDSLDVIIINGILQYLEKIELKELLATLDPLLKDDGVMVIGDIIPRDRSIFADAAALLSFGFKSGFFIAAVYGLLRTFFSEYRGLLLKFGLRRYDEAEILAILRAAGFVAQRRHLNIGHNQGRMTFVASRLGGSSQDAEGTVRSVRKAVAGPVNSLPSPESHSRGNRSANIPVTSHTGHLVL